MSQPQTTPQSTLISTGSGDNIIRDKIVMSGNGTFVIGDVNFTPSVSNPEGNVKHLQRSLEQNRETVNADLAKLRKLISEGYLLDNASVAAVIKDAISGMKNIEYLIPNIKLRGGLAESEADEGNILKRLNDAITQEIEKKAEAIKVKVAQEEEEVLQYKVGLVIAGLVLLFAYSYWDSILPVLIGLLKIGLGIIVVVVIGSLIAAWKS
jgi:hypothetical protein